MRSVTIAALSTIGLVSLLLVAILAGRVGGVAIRSQGAQTTPFFLEVSEPIIRGVPVVVRWGDENLPQAITVFFRDREQEYVVGRVDDGESRATVIIPCDIQGDRGSLVLKDSSSDMVIAWQEVAISVPGPECVNSGF